MKRAIILAACAAILSGCAALLHPAAEEIARGVTKYCDEESPENRAAFRATVNSELPEGYQVHIHCPGDPDD
jgi:hypothetical protein